MSVTVSFDQNNFGYRMTLGAKLKLHLKNAAIGAGMGFGFVGAAMLGAASGIPTLILLTTGVALVGSVVIVGTMAQKGTFRISSMLPSMAGAAIGSMMLFSHIAAGMKSHAAEAVFSEHKALVVVFDAAAKRQPLVFFTKPSTAFRLSG